MKNPGKSEVSYFCQNGIKNLTPPPLLNLHLKSPPQVNILPPGGVGGWTTPTWTLKSKGAANFEL